MKKGSYGFTQYFPTPCGHCSGCIKDKVNMWSDRCTFESMTTQLPSSFLTLTYNDWHLPKDKGVHLEDFQLFNDRLRHSGIPKYKYFVSSEYGLEDFRPHYHVMLFGFDWQDKKSYDALYQAWSPKSDEIGFFEVDYLTAGRIRYGLKYMSKEMSPDRQDDILKRGLPPLFHTMSKGIGRDWFFKNLNDIQSHNGYYNNGKLRPLPRYYQELLGLIRDNHVPLDVFTKKFEHYSDLAMYRTGKYWNVNRAPVHFSYDTLFNRQREYHMVLSDFLFDSSKKV